MHERPLKICIAVPYDLAEEGGVKNHAVHLAESLRARGDIVEIVGPCSRGFALGEGIEGFGGIVNIRNNGSDNRLAIFASPLKAWRFMRRGFDILHLMEPINPSLNWYLSWFASGATRIATFHAFSEDEATWARRARVFTQFQLWLIAQGIAVSPAAQRFAAVAFKAPIAVIPNGIDLDVFTPSADDESRRDDARVRFLFVGHHRDVRKGLDVLLRAFAAVRRQHPDVSLTVVGDGPRRDVEGVSFRGPVSDRAELAGIYRAHDVFCAPSLGMESFGIVLLEAMATARPVI